MVMQAFRISWMSSRRSSAPLASFLSIVSGSCQRFPSTMENSKSRIAFCSRTRSWTHGWRSCRNIAPRWRRCSSITSSAGVPMSRKASPMMRVLTSSGSGGIRATAMAEVRSASFAIVLPGNGSSGSTSTPPAARSSRCSHSLPRIHSRRCAAEYVNSSSVIGRGGLEVRFFLPDFVIGRWMSSASSLGSGSFSCKPEASSSGSGLSSPGTVGSSGSTCSGSDSAMCRSRLKRLTASRSSWSKEL